jgi:hypothetical protein
MPDFVLLTAGILVQFASRLGCAPDAAEAIAHAVMLHAWKHCAALAACRGTTTQTADGVVWDSLVGVLNREVCNRRS